MVCVILKDDSENKASEITEVKEMRQMVLCYAFLELKYRIFHNQELHSLKSSPYNLG
jgi:hypothetical protein